MGCFDERRQVAVHYNIGAGHEGGEVGGQQGPTPAMSFRRPFRRKFHCWAIC